MNLLRPLVISATLIASAPAVIAQDSAKVSPTPILNSHRVSGPVAACLADLQEDCILAASLAVVIDEALAVERIKVLTALARGLAEAGDMTMAQRPLDMAIEELGEIKFSFVRRMKQVEIAPVLALMGDADKALAMLSGFRGLDRDRALENAMMMAARSGDVEGVLALRGAMTLYKGRSAWFLMDAMEGMDAAGYRAEALSLGQRIRGDKMIAGSASSLLRLASLYRAAGDDSGVAALLAQASALDSMGGRPYLKLQSRAERVIFHLNKPSSLAFQTAEEQFSLSKDMFKSTADLRDIAPFLGRYHIKKGETDKALAMVQYFTSPETKVHYLMTVTRVRGTQQTENIGPLVDQLLEEITALESPLERDDVRFKLLKAMRHLGSLSLAQKVVMAIEDDDNAAKGLALLLPLLKK